MTSYDAIYLALTALGVVVIPAVVALWRVHRSRVRNEIDLRTLQDAHGNVDERVTWLERALMQRGIAAFSDMKPGDNVMFWQALTAIATVIASVNGSLQYRHRRNDDRRFREIHDHINSDNLGGKG